MGKKERELKLTEDDERLYLYVARMCLVTMYVCAWMYRYSGMSVLINMYVQYVCVRVCFSCKCGIK